MKVLYRKQRQAWQDAACELLKRVGAKRIPDNIPGQPTFTLETKAGPLMLGVCSHIDMCNMEVVWGPWHPWVWSRFENVPACVELLGKDRVNRFSGKWNHHYWTQGWQLDYSWGLAQLERDLRSVTSADQPVAVNSGGR